MIRGLQLIRIEYHMGFKTEAAKSLFWGKRTACWRRASTQNGGNLVYS